MGQGLTLPRFFGKTKNINILIVGLDCAGKTTLLHKLQDNVTVTIPTIGMNVETVQYKNLQVTSWDVGGRAKMRPLYRHYYSLMDAVIFVVDSSDRDSFRLDQAADQLQRLMGEEELTGTPVVILANKQDLPGAGDVQQVTRDLDVHRFQRHRTVAIFPTSMTTEDGLWDAMEWMVDQVKRKTQPATHTGGEPAEKGSQHLLKSLAHALSTSLKGSMVTVKKNLHIS